MYGNDIDIFISIIRLPILIFIAYYAIKLIRLSEIWKAPWSMFVGGLVFIFIGRVASIQIFPDCNTWENVVFGDMLPTVGYLLLGFSMRKIYQIFEHYLNHIKAEWKKKKNEKN